MPETTKQRSIENYGVGQSGYTAGRVAGDHALEQLIEERNMSYAKGTDEQPDGLGDDDRFTGRGGRHWAPEAPSHARPRRPPGESSSP